MVAILKSIIHTESTINYATAEELLNVITERRFVRA
jgi:hypothetical protein